MRFLTKHGFVNADFDGCMCGLVAEKGPMAGIPINKPWRVACSPNSSLPRLLNKKCDRSHDHTPCAGANTLGTQGYTDDVCKIVHQSIQYDNARIGTLNQSSDAGVKISLVAIAEPKHENTAAVCLPRPALCAVAAPLVPLAFSPQLSCSVEMAPKQYAKIAPAVVGAGAETWADMAEENRQKCKASTKVGGKKTTWRKFQGVLAQGASPMPTPPSSSANAGQPGSSTDGTYAAKAREALKPKPKQGAPVITSGLGRGPPMGADSPSLPKPGKAVNIPRPTGPPPKATKAKAQQPKAPQGPPPKKATATSVGGASPAQPGSASAAQGSGSIGASPGTTDPVAAQVAEAMEEGGVFRSTEEESGEAAPQQQGIMSADFRRSFTAGAISAASRDGLREWLKYYVIPTNMFRAPTKTPLTHRRAIVMARKGVNSILHPDKNPGDEFRELRELVITELDFIFNEMSQITARPGLDDPFPRWTRWIWQPRPTSRRRSRRTG